MAFLGRMFGSLLRQAPRIIGGLFRKAPQVIGNIVKQKAIEKATEVASEGAKTLIDKTGLANIPVIGGLADTLKSGVDAGASAGSGAAKNYFQVT
jgi:hypothetical protein